MFSGDRTRDADARDQGRGWYRSRNADAHDDQNL